MKTRWKLLIFTHQIEGRLEPFYRTENVFLDLIQNLFQCFSWYKKSEMSYRDQLVKPERANCPFIWVRHPRKTVSKPGSQAGKGTGVFFLGYWVIPLEGMALCLEKGQAGRRLILQSQKRLKFKGCCVSCKTCRAHSQTLTMFWSTRCVWMKIKQGRRSWGKRRQAEHRGGDGEEFWCDQPPAKKYKKYKCPTTRVTLTNSSLSKIFILTHVLLLSLNPSLQLFLAWQDLVVQRGDSGINWSVQIGEGSWNCCIEWQTTSELTPQVTESEADLHRR